MADTAPITENGEEEVQLSFNVKSSSDAKYTMTMPASATVLDLKTKLSSTEYADLPTDRQRLIYSGRVLKDSETLGSYNIKEGNTLHLVKGAASNQRQNPPNQSSSSTSGSNGGTTASSGVPTNLAAGTANNPLAALTGARYAGFHPLPGADMFGPDGGMGPPPDQEQLLRMMENPMFLSQMNEAMNNPAVIQMMRDSPMIRDNPMARAMLDNPALRQMMISPETIRAQMQLNRAMGGGLGGGGGSFPAPGTTDNTATNPATGAGENTAQGSDNANNTGANNPLGSNLPFNPFANPNMFAGGESNPLAQLLGVGMNQPNMPSTSTPSSNEPNQDNPTQTNPSQPQGNQSAAPNPFALLSGMPPASGAGNNSTAADSADPNQQPNNNNNNPFGQLMQQMMQGMAQNAGAARDPSDLATMMGLGNMPGFNPAQLGAGLGGLGGLGGGNQGAQEQQPADTRPPEERYADQLRQLNDMGFFEFDRNVTALRRSGGSVQGAVEYLLSG